MADLARRWSRWRRLSAADRRILAALVLLLPLADLALRTAGLRRVQHWLARWTRDVPPARRPLDPLAFAERLAELAAIAGAHGLYRNTCLRQALVVQHWLRRRGLPARLCVGALAQPGGALDAHAWVELDGVALAQPRLRHVPFDGLDRLSR